MKQLISIALIALSAFSSFAAADWSYRYGIGSSDAEVGFTGNGVPLAVVGSVHSNAVYWVGSSAGPGVPTVEQIWLKSDNADCTLKAYVGVRETTTSAAGIAGTNFLAVTDTNVLAPNAFVLLRNANDSYQLLINSNNITGRLYNTVTNAYAAGDKVYKLAEVQSFTPLGITAITNQVIVPTTDWVPFGVNGSYIQFTGRKGAPMVLVLTYTTAGTMHLQGKYSVLPRR